MLLDEKVCVVYGAGAIGGAVARGFGAEGARVYVGDRTDAKAKSVGDVQGTPLVEMAWDDFMAPIEAAVRSHFLTVKAAVPHMPPGGAVLFFGVPESIDEDFEGSSELREMLAAATLTGRAATFEDVGAVAAFVASDKARTMTAATVNVSAGALID
ncbi:MAG: SDR family oxidoreductase [Actinobacteria bacterium]|nr:SDR family oxidoreductase [Actinomycetota bacterium]